MENKDISKRIIERRGKRKTRKKTISNLLY